MADFISARIEPMESDYPRDLRTNLFKQGEYEGDPSMPLNLETHINKGNHILKAKG